MYEILSHSKPRENPRPSLNLETRESTFITKVIRFLLSKGITPNLFTGTPDPEEVTKVKLKFMNDSTPAEDLDQQPPVVASIILLDHLSRLSEPLLTFKSYDSFILTTLILKRTDRLEVCRNLLDYLPPRHRTVVHQLLTLLSQISLNSEKTNHTPQSLALLFAPIFAKPAKQIYYMEKDATTSVPQLVSFLIENFTALMTVETDLSNKELYAPKPFRTDFTKARSGSITRVPKNTTGSPTSPGGSLQSTIGSSLVLSTSPYVIHLVRDTNNNS
eukprot:TRINITY_DN565_c0_g1_i1.p1 TRINITY_DN565_c0_g1~~TRINITY_DN565_c0_g1_i1.p1  ORF type:complete len:274 (-),score=52.59 TRINITY_DN565_c0_g1_i1:194-1015(-)